MDGWNDTIVSFLGFGLFFRGRLYIAVSFRGGYFDWFFGQDFGSVAEGVSFLWWHFPKTWSSTLSSVTGVNCEGTSYIFTFLLASKSTKSTDITREHVFSCLKLRDDSLWVKCFVLGLAQRVSYIVVRQIIQGVMAGLGGWHPQLYCEKTHPPTSPKQENMLWKWNRWVNWKGFSSEVNFLERVGGKDLFRFSMNQCWGAHKTFITACWFFH